MSYRVPLATERLYPSHGLAALVRLLRDEGVPGAVALRGTGFAADAFDDANRLTSADQYFRACRNALAAAGDGSLAFRSSLAFRLGERLRLSDYGIYGLLLLSCASMRDCFMLAVKYQPLAAPALAIDVAEIGDGALWILSGETNDVPEDLRIFLTELNVAQQVSRVREVLGAPCVPLRIRFACPAPAHRDLYERHFGCPCDFDAPRTEVWYPRALLGRRPSLANAHTAGLLQSACDDMLEEIDASAGMAGKVYRTLCGLRDPGAGMKTVASALRMTDRTLRRRLADEGTTFSTISDRVRYLVATQYLKDSDASVEQVAAIAGFSDPANFRRAFVRWTNMSPAQFRRLQHRSAFRHAGEALHATLRAPAADAPRPQAARLRISAIRSDFPSKPMPGSSGIAI